MAISKLKGEILASNLTRNGVDLAFETNLLYFDVTNDRIGINTSTPSTSLDVIGNVQISTTLNVTGASTLATAKVTDLTAGGIVISGTLGELESDAELTYNSTTNTLGVPNISAPSGNLTITAPGNINLTADSDTSGGGLVDITGTDGLNIPDGTTAERPTIGLTAGVIRFNSDVGNLEVYNGAGWIDVGPTGLINQVITGDGSTVAFTLTRASSAIALLVSTNGVIQVPNVDYSTSGTTLTFSEAPLSSDTVELRFISATTNVGGIADALGTTTVFASTSQIDVEITSTNVLTIDSTAIKPKTDIIPYANSTYDLGSTTKKWDNVYATLFTGSYADLAEMYVADEDYEPGTVVSVGGEKEITASNLFNSHSVVGVVSENPAYLMNAEQEDGTPIALKGKVKVKIIGSVRKGDRLAPSNVDGYAVSNNQREAWSFAISLEDSNENSAVTAIIL
jgi:hypothetical protein